ncbi:MAG: hypothetical protein JW384_01027 [Nitrosomonadaceae bacterium]|nr:hypothetical protein [Nitrosomonadaceae bacterium]
MKIKLIFVPPDGGEADYSLMMELPQIPNKGDYISIQRVDRTGSDNFIVRRTWWELSYDEKAECGTADAVNVGH